MTQEEAREEFGKKVRFRGKYYKLTGYCCRIIKNEKCIQLELLDLMCDRCIVTARCEDVEKI